MSLDLSKPRLIYRELFGVDMPPAVEGVVMKLCVLYKISPDNMEITHFIINGWLQEKMKVIPQALSDKATEAGIAISQQLQKAGNELIKIATTEARAAADNQAIMLQNKFTSTAIAEISRIANEAKSLAPSQYKVVANILLGGVCLASLLMGYWGGIYKSKAEFIDQLQNQEATSNMWMFSKLDVRLSGVKMAGVKINSDKSIQFLPAQTDTINAEKVLSLSNPWMSGFVGLLLGSVVMFIVGYRHKINDWMARVFGEDGGMA